MTFDERVIEEFRRKVYAKKVREFIYRFLEKYDRIDLPDDDDEGDEDLEGEWIL